MIDKELDYSLDDIYRFEEQQKAPEFPLPITVKSAEGCYLIDDNGNKYLDLTSNKETQPFGYSKINAGSDIFFYNSELFNSSDALKLEKSIKNLTGMKKACFTSSCSDACELTRQLIKDYQDLSQKSKILISSNNRENYIEEGIIADFIPINKDTVLKSVFTKAVSAVIIEIVQIEDGIIVADKEYLSYVRDLCDKNNSLLIYDVSSIAPLRLGAEFFNYELSIKPDVLIISKGLTQGIPFGALIVSDKVSEIPLNISNTGTTTLAYQLASKLIDDYNRHDLKGILDSNSRYLRKNLDELAQNHISIIDIQSYGMMFAMQLDISAYDFAEECFKKGIIVEAISQNIIKLSPPYTIGKEEIDKMVSTMDYLFDKLAKFDRLN